MRERGFFRLGRSLLQTRAMKKYSMLHITDGESVAGTLREVGIPGDVSVYGDLMYEGPAPAGLTPEAWRDARARFLSEAGYTTLEDARRYLRACEDALSSFGRYEQVVIWLDHRLSDQLILIRVLDWFSRQNLGGVELGLIVVGHYPGIDHFTGLGELTADRLASLADTRMTVTDAQFRLARAAWDAFTSADPTAMERFRERNTSVLPFVAGAFRRHLEQFPSVDGGLSRTQRQALSILREQGTLPGRRLFSAVQRLEEQLFMADSSFYRIMKTLSTGRRPLVQMSGSGTVALTETGRDVIEGRADHIALNGIDEWLGGVHLKGERAVWRWDRTSARLVRA